MNHLLLTGVFYAVSVIVSWLFIRFGYSMEDFSNKSEEEIAGELKFWFLMMFIPFVNIVVPVIGIFRVMSKKNSIKTFLFHFFLSKKNMPTKSK